MNGVVKFYIWVIQIAITLGAMGALKDATLAMAGHAAHAQRNMISYSKFTRMLTALATQKR